MRPAGTGTGQEFPNATARERSHECIAAASPGKKAFYWELGLRGFAPTKLRERVAGRTQGNPATLLHFLMAMRTEVVCHLLAPVSSFT
jgi:hypothetical protein